MVINFDGTSAELSPDGALRNQGKKIDLGYYDLTVTSDNQTVFTMPFTWITGDDIAVVYGGIKYKKDIDFTVTDASSQLTLLSSGNIPVVNSGDTIEVYG